MDQNLRHPFGNEQHTIVDDFQRGLTPCPCIHFFVGRPVIGPDSALLASLFCSTSVAEAILLVAKEAEENWHQKVEFEWEVGIMADLTFECSILLLLKFSLGKFPFA